MSRIGRCCGARADTPRLQLVTAQVIAAVDSVTPAVGPAAGGNSVIVVGSGCASAMNAVPVHE
eukprot:SAG11_NODE_13901_length_634_cov_0.869159_1_plen_62_part_10